MKTLLLLLLLISSTICIADTYVRGYYKSNGTYVDPHYRSSPNNTTLDNYSTKGNVNPYTGREGTRDPVPNNQYNAMPMEGLAPLPGVDRLELLNSYPR